MAWSTLKATERGGMPPNPTPALRIITKRSGYLNVAARRALFGDARQLLVLAGEHERVEMLPPHVAFQEDEDGRYSLRAADDGAPVSKTGRVTVTALTSAVDGPIPVTLQLAPCDEPGRLIITGVKP